MAPDDTKTATTRFESQTAGAFELQVKSGPEQGQSIRLDTSAPSALLVGQSPACDLRLTDPMVSRRHFSVDMRGNRVRLRDLGSTNGTRVNGLVVRDAELAGGEEILIGQSALCLLPVGEASVAPAIAATRFERIFGKSEAMRRLYPLLERLAQSDVPVVIEGETGTGKEVAAESIHAHSARASGPYVVFDCTTLAPNLVEAELFGHERGAFTGAVASRKGVFEQAHGGTLLIDEIGDLALPLQPKLLRALERGEIRRVGGNQTERVDVRVIAATRRDLDQAVVQGRFRDDLFHRLAVARVELPPLRERAGDVAELARRFWEDFGGSPPIPANVMARWVTYDWPGNVRELRNAVARQIALGDLAPDDLGPARPEADSAGHDLVTDTLGQRLPLPVARAQIVAEFERRYIEQALADHDGNVADAARASGVARRYFQLLRSGKRRQ